MYTVATTISTICGNYFTQHIPLHIPRRSLNKPKPIPDYLPDKLITFNYENSKKTLR